MFDLKGVCQEYMASKKTGFSHDRSKTVGGSEIGACARRVGYEKHLGKAGYDKGYPDNLGMAERGNLLEDYYSVPLIKFALDKAYGHLPLKKRPVLLWAGQKEQTTLVAEGAPLSATPDGLIANAPKDFLKGYGVEDIGSDCVVCEIKSADPRTSEKNLPKETHVWQVVAQMGLIRSIKEEGSKGHKPEYAIIMYVNASDLGDIKVYPVKFDQAMFKAQLGRAKMIMDNDPELMRPEAKITGSGECRYCPFGVRCLGYAAYVPKETRDVPPKVMRSLATMAKAVEEAKAKAEEYGQIAEAKKAEIKETLAANQSKYVRGKDFVLGWKQTAGRGSYNYDAMKAKLAELGVDPEQFKKEGKPGEQLDVEVF